MLDGSPIINYENRAFKYGDALFETIHASGTNIQFLNNHLQRLKSGMKILKMEIPSTFNEKKLKYIIENLIIKNKFFKGLKVRFTVFRKEGGLYTPESNQISYLIETEKLHDDKYVLNKNGFIIDYYNEIKKTANKLSNLKTANALIYILAGIYKKENNLDDCIIINNNNNCVEAISSNLFLVKENIIYTPSLTDGCVDGIMRKKIINIALSLNYTVFDECSIKPDDILKADEVFITNAIKGIQWVIAFRQRRYFNKTAKVLIQKLNEIAFGL